MEEKRMEPVQEDLCRRCASKCDLREIMRSLARLEERIMGLEHSTRVSHKTTHSVHVMQTRNFAKMMEGFRAIHKGFRMACGAAVDVQEELSEHLGVLKI